MNNGLFSIPNTSDGRLIRYIELGPFPLALNSVEYVGIPFERNVIVSAKLHCILADNGWFPDEEIIVGVSGIASANNGIGIAVLPGTIKLITGSALAIVPKAGGAAVAITITRWKLFLSVLG